MSVNRAFPKLSIETGLPITSSIFSLFISLTANGFNISFDDLVVSSALTLKPLFCNAKISATEIKSSYVSPFGFVTITDLRVVVPEVGGFIAVAN